MRLLLHVPLPRGSTRGNWITATRWAEILTSLGHTVRTVDPAEFPGTATDTYDALIALNARRSEAEIRHFRENSGSSKIIVVLTGTDLHVDLACVSADGDLAMNSLELADRIVLLEPQGIKQLKPALHSKCRVIYQSSPVSVLPKKPAPEFFTISLLAHLREVKNPFLVNQALELLPVQSKTRVFHAGHATTDAWHARALQWAQRCSRYEWLGPIPHQDAMSLLANSQLTVLTSHHEGAPSVFSEAVAQGVPILSSRITAALGILGTDHPGLFTAGDAAQLADLVWRAETDQCFYQELCSASNDLRVRLSPEAELNSWRELIAELAFIEGEEHT